MPYIHCFNFEIVSIIAEVQTIEEKPVKIQKVIEKDEKKKEKKTTDIMVCFYGFCIFFIIIVGWDSDLILWFM